MKVFTVDTKLKLEIFPSVKKFLAQCDGMGWCDHKYISVHTAKELREFASEPYAKRMIIHSEDQIKAHNILHEEFKKLRKN